MSKSVIDQLSEDTAPKNFSEFELGMVLAALYNEMNQDENDFDPVVYDNMMEKAPQALEYWRVKYADEISSAGKQAREGINRGE
jgi:hypothetical protein